MNHGYKEPSASFYAEQEYSDPPFWKRYGHYLIRTPHLYYYGQLVSVSAAEIILTNYLWCEIDEIVETVEAGTYKIGKKFHYEPDFKKIQHRVAYSSQILINRSHILDIKNDPETLARMYCN